MITQNLINSEMAQQEGVFKSINTVSACGKIIKIYSPKENETRVILSCGRISSTPKKNENGLFVRDILTVYFFDGNAEGIKKLYEVGDFVRVFGVVQSVRDHYTQQSRTELWGLKMTSKVNAAGKLVPDHNRVHIRGKVASARAVTDTLVLVNVQTNVDEEYPNLREGSEVKTIKNNFRSVTPIAIWCDGNAEEVVKNYTAGTWVDCRCFVRIRESKRDDNKVLRIPSIVAARSTVIGTVAIVQ